ncbi:MAG: nucleotidyl transferase AbiEii/AbiGii toxin family protein [Agriterribacter sp.]
MKALYWLTVNHLLKKALISAMNSSALSSFRLVGGTSLSLQLGHRKSVDIDLFTDATYNSIDFNAIDGFFKSTFPYVSTNNPGQPGMGTSYFLGNDAQDAIKVDLYYTDTFIRPELKVGNIRLAMLEDISAMKLDVISRGGRKKDFWDLHELADHHHISAMMQFHQERYPYSHNYNLLKAMLNNFSLADDDFEPDCLRGKHWELIKLDIVQLSKLL